MRQNLLDFVDIQRDFHARRSYFGGLCGIGHQFMSKTPDYTVSHPEVGISTNFDSVVILSERRICASRSTRAGRAQQPRVWPASLIVKITNRKCNHQHEKK